MTTPPLHAVALPYVEGDVGAVPRAGFTEGPSPDGSAVLVAGECPRCHGRTEGRFPIGQPGTGSKGVLDWLPGRKPVDTAQPGPLLGERHFCECRHAHTGIPADSLAVGCGASWTVTP